MDDLGRLLLKVEAALDDDIRLADLAREAGVSPFHFHRRFSERLGETPRQHVERMRLERAAYLVAVTDVPLIDIGMAVGFNSPETFARAFRRRFQQAPSAYRREAYAALAERKERMRDFRGDGCQLSEVRFVRLPRETLLTVRRTGPYSSTNLPPFSDADAYWSRLLAWAQAHGVPVRREPWGFFPDSPGVTPPHLMRADICLPADAAFEGDDEVRRLDFAGGAYAVIEHLGPYETIDQAYRGCADGIRRSRDWVFAEGPPLQTFRRWGIGGDPDLNLSEVAFPVRRKKRQA